MNLRKGVYSTRQGDIVILENVRVYEDRKSIFAIVDWTDKNGRYTRTLISDRAAKSLTRIGSL